MKKCQFCQAELPEEETVVCPACGKNVTADAEAEDEFVTKALPAEVQEAVNALYQEELASGSDKAEGEAEEIVETQLEEAPAVEEEAPEEKEESTESAEEAEQEQTEEPAQEEAAPEAEAKKATPGKIAAAVAAVVVLAAVLIALVLAGRKDKPVEEPAQTTAAPTEQAAEATVPADGNPGDVTCKGSYTVSDEEAVAAKDTVVAAIGDQVLTNGELQVYYWSMVNSYLTSEFGYTLMMYGLLDYTQPLDTMVCFEDETLTWQQYFLQEALNYWQLMTSLSGEAAKAGYEVSAEDQAYLDEIPASLEATAANYGVSREELLRKNFGPGMGLEEFVAFQSMYAQGKDFYEDKLAQIQPTQEQLEQFFDEHAEGYAESGIDKSSTYVDVRHILFQVEGGTAAEDGSVVYSEEEWEACRQKAQAALDQWLAGEKTEESFAALANTVSEDPGSNTNGGLYENVYKGQMVEPFEAWCFDESRQYGDTGLVQTSYGYHVMFYVSSEPMWISYVESDWIQDQVNQFMESMTAQYPMEVYYDKISLGYINLGG